MTAEGAIQTLNHLGVQIVLAGQAVEMILPPVDPPGLAEAVAEARGVKDEIARLLRLQADIGCLDCGAETESLFCDACYGFRATVEERKRHLDLRLANLPKLIAQPCCSCGAPMTGTSLGDAFCSARCWERSAE